MPIGKLPFRPLYVVLFMNNNDDDRVLSFMKARGYQNVTGQLLRNIWFTHPSFQPSLRPGLDSHCFNGCRKAVDDQLHGPNKNFQLCPMTE